MVTGIGWPAQKQAPVARGGPHQDRNHFTFLGVFPILFLFTGRGKERKKQSDHIDRGVVGS